MKAMFIVGVFFLLGAFLVIPNLPGYLLDGWRANVLFILSVFTGSAIMVGGTR
jgi:hypothetical protein